MTEYLDLFTKDGNPLKKTILRGTPLESGEYVKVVLDIILNQQDQILITQRSPRRKIAPGLWESTAGAITSGENSEQAALREAREEVGQDLTAFPREYQGHFLEDQAIFETWLFKGSFRLEDLTLDNAEVATARLVSLRELKEIAHSEKATKSLKKVWEYLRKIFHN